MSPNLFTGAPSDIAKDDVFACGVVLFIMVTGIHPFFEATQKDPLFKLIIQKKYEKFWQGVDETRKKCDLPILDLSNELKGLIFQMMSADENYRPSFEQIEN